MVRSETFKVSFGHLKSGLVHILLRRERPSHGHDVRLVEPIVLQLHQEEFNESLEQRGRSIQVLEE